MANAFRGFHLAAVSLTDFNSVVYVMRISNGISGWTPDYRKARRYETRAEADRAAAAYRENGASVCVVPGSPVYRDFNAQPFWMKPLFIGLAILLMVLSLYAFTGLATANVAIDGDLTARLLYALPVLGSLAAFICLVISAKA
jgi:hypothetical protein